MVLLAEGNLHTQLHLQEDNSEVGNIVVPIFSKQKTAYAITV